jgi:anti-sigma B factor antagonist
MNNMESQFELTQEGTILTINLSEELATANATALMEEINNYRETGVEKVVFDATKLSYIASSGIRAIYYAKQKVAGNPAIEFINCAQNIRDVFEMVGIQDQITFVNK